MKRCSGIRQNISLPVQHFLMKKTWPSGCTGPLCRAYPPVSIPSNTRTAPATITALPRLARWVLQRASDMETPPVELSFKYSGSGRRITILEPLVGKNGSLAANRLTVKALESEDYIVLGAVTDDGLELDAEQARRLFSLTASTGPAHCDIAVNAAGVYSSLKNIILNDISERNALFFEEEMDKLNRWAEDRRKSHKYTLKIYDIRAWPG